MFVYYSWLLTAHICLLHMIVYYTCFSATHVCLLHLGDGVLLMKLKTSKFIQSFLFFNVEGGGYVPPSTYVYSKFMFISVVSYHILYKNIKANLILLLSLVTNIVSTLLFWLGSAQLWFMILLKSSCIHHLCPPQHTLCTSWPCCCYYGFYC